MKHEEFRTQWSGPSQIRTDCQKFPALDEEKLHLLWWLNLFFVFVRGCLLKKTYLEILLDAYDVYVREAAINVDCVTVSDEEINWNVLIKFIVQYVKAWEN